jgi:hypothetical protein
VIRQAQSQGQELERRSHKHHHKLAKSLRLDISAITGIDTANVVSTENRPDDNAAK